MPYILIIIGFVFLLYAISRLIKQSNSPKLTLIFRYGGAVILGALGFLILVRGNMAIGGILGLLSALSAQGSLWRFLIAPPDQAPDRRKSAGRPTTQMSKEEALSILDLAGNPTPTEVKEAHHKLMMKMHPDQGGSDYFASKLNQARDVLLTE